MNNISPQIQFTMEIETDNSLHSIDVLVSFQTYGTLTHQVYRKNTHTKSYLNYNSHHHPTQKSIVLKTMVTQAIGIFAPQFLEK